MDRSPLLLGVDAGTTRIRALVHEPDGTLVAAGAAPTPTDRPRPGWAEHDPQALWGALVAAVREALARLDDPGRIAGVAVASVGEAGVALDGAGEPVHPAVAWFDERAGPQRDALEAGPGSERLFEVTGLRLDRMFSLCKLLWLRDNAPEAFGRARAWLMIADYLAWRLCGERATDHSLASRTLALDLGRLRWADDLLGELGLPAGLLQPLAASGTRLGTVSAAASTETGLPRSCAVGVGGHDHIVGALPVGGWRSGTLLDSLGTAEALLLARDRPLFDAQVARSGFSQGAMVVEEPRYYAVGAMTTSGACVEWFRDAVADGAAHQALIRAGEAVPPGSDGVWFFPQMRVGTPPSFEPATRGAYLGLRPETGRPALYRALLEGLAYDAWAAAESLAAMDGAPAVERVVAIGGDARNALLMRIKAAVHAQTFTVVDVEEAVGLGAALLGGLAGGVFASVDEALGGLALGACEVAPEPELVRAYGPGRAFYATLPGALGALHGAAPGPDAGGKRG